jgi:hypothetical protein
MQSRQRIQGIVVQPTQFQKHMLFNLEEAMYFRCSRITQAAIVVAFIADSSHNKFMIICFSNDLSNLRTCVRQMLSMLK